MGNTSQNQLLKKWQDEYLKLNKTIKGCTIYNYVHRIATLFSLAITLWIGFGGFKLIFVLFSSIVLIVVTILFIAKITKEIKKIKNNTMKALSEQRIDIISNELLNTIETKKKEYKKEKRRAIICFIVVSFIGLPIIIGGTFINYPLYLYLTAVVVFVLLLIDLISRAILMNKVKKQEEEVKALPKEEPGRRYYRY